MMANNVKKTMLGLGMGLAAVLAIAFTAGQLNVEAQQPAAAFSVGTYNPQAVFERHPAQARLMEITETLQTAMQQAQQEGDAARMQQIQQEYEQEHTQAVEQFQRDVSRAVPVAAETAGVSVVAVEIVYAAADVQTRDITQQVVQVLDDYAGEEQDPPGVPQVPLPQE